MQRRSYTEEERRAVVEEAQQIGVCAAARKHGIDQSNVSRWLAKTGEHRSPRSKSKQAQASKRKPRQGSKPKQAQTSKRKPKQGSEPKAEQATRKRTARKYTPSQVAEAIEYASKHGVQAAAEKLGMSRFTVYDWLAKSKRAAKGEGPSPTSGAAPEEIEAQRDQEILAEWKRHPGLGPSQIRNQLRRKRIKVSTRTVRRVMEDAGYRPPKVKRTKHDERWNAVRPNHVWHLDYVHRFINRADAHTLILLDDCARFVTGHGVSDAERADFVIETFEDAIGRHGKPEMVLHDKGSAFWSWRGISRFTAYLTELGIDQVVAEEKEWNGKIEAFNGNLHTELFDVNRFYDLAEMRRRLAAHLHWYNNVRLHSAIGFITPADQAAGRGPEIWKARDEKLHAARERRRRLRNPAPASAPNAPTEAIA